MVMDLLFLVPCLSGACTEYLGGKAQQQLSPAAEIPPRKPNTALVSVTSDFVAGESL